MNLIGRVNLLRAQKDNKELPLSTIAELLDVNRSSAYYKVKEPSFREKGYYQVSIDEITKKVGIAKGTFYNFFPSKKDILLIWAAQKFHEMQTDAHILVNSKKTAYENMNNLIAMLCRLVEQEQTLFFVFIRGLIQSNKETRSNGEYNFPSLIHEILSGSADFINIGRKNIDIKVRVINDSLFYEII